MSERASLLAGGDFHGASYVCPGSAVFVGTVVVSGQSSFAPTIPQTWDDRAVASLQVPLATASARPIQIPSAYYYGIPVRPIYKSYPVYHPSKEPPDYIDWLEAAGAAGRLRCRPTQDGS